MESKEKGQRQLQDKDTTHLRTKLDTTKLKTLQRKTMGQNNNIYNKTTSQWNAIFVMRCVKS